METTDEIIDSTLNVMSNSLATFDNTLGKLPLFKGGHNVGNAISKFIDSLVDSLPI